MWPVNKIPYTYHINIAEVPKRRASVEEAIRKIEEDSCLEFEDISLSSWMTICRTTQTNIFIITSI